MNQEMTPEQRQFLREAWLSGVPTPEIATRLGRTEGSVRNAAAARKLKRPKHYISAIRRDAVISGRIDARLFN